VLVSETFLIPQRFIYEYADRVLAMMAAFEPLARRGVALSDGSYSGDLRTSFPLIMASSLLVIPLERLKGEHFLREAERERRIYDPMAAALKKRFMEAPFRGTGAWYALILDGSVDQPTSWNVRGGRPILDESHRTRADHAKTSDHVFVIRNALAHGNIVYLDEQGHYAPTHEAFHLAFISRRDVEPGRCRDLRGVSACLSRITDQIEGRETPKKPPSYNVVVTSDETFLSFLKAWAEWLLSLGRDERLVVAAAD
jgi:hypothetical protein